MRYYINLSYGKDSMAMLIECVKHKLPIDEIIYCKIMATPTISAELPEMLEFIKYADNVILKKQG